MSANALARWLTKTDWRLLWISIACSAIYFFSPPWRPFTGSWALKGACVALLAVVAWRRLLGRERYLMTAALLLSSTGDVLLALGNRFFVYGLGAFLLAHLCYGALFVLYRPSPFRVRADQWALVAAVLLYSVALGWRIWPGLGDMKWPVVAYIAVITLMVTAAALAGFVTQLVVLGAVLFLISDSLIGLDRFHQKLAYADYWIWGTYYLGQLGLALGFLRELRQQQMPAPETAKKKKLRNKRNKRN
jgi:uncharacterized membrane protein YhhN